MMGRALCLLAVVGVLYAGFALLALSQTRHWRAIGGAAPLPRGAVIVVRAIGLALLALAHPIAVLRDGAGFGSLLWGMSVTLAACAVTATLSWRSRWLKPLAAAIVLTLAAGRR